MFPKRSARIPLGYGDSVESLSGPFHEVDTSYHSMAWLWGTPHLFLTMSGKGAGSSLPGRFLIILYAI